MKSFARIAVIALLVVAGVFVAQQISPNSTPAQDEENQSAETEAQNQEQEDSENEESSDDEQQAASPYSYTAQAGDSYAKIARKAVQTHGINNNVNLSQAQIVAAETFLTSDAGFPSLNLGEEISLDEAAVEAAVEKAEDLDEAAVARWQKYIVNVNFNTNSVGEAQN